MSNIISKFNTEFKVTSDFNAETEDESTSVTRITNLVVDVFQKAEEEAKTRSPRPFSFKLIVDEEDGENDASPSVSPRSSSPRFCPGLNIAKEDRNDASPSASPRFSPCPLNDIADDTDLSSIASSFRPSPLPDSSPSPRLFSRSSILMGPAKKDADYVQDVQRVQKWVDQSPPKRIGAQLEAVEYGQKGNANGVYLIKDEAGEFKGIFKPSDEERGAPKCPKLDAKDASKYGIKPGEGWVGEVLAYYLDDELVPATSFITLTSPCFHDKDVPEELPKIRQGSFQEFVPDFTPFINLSQSDAEEARSKVGLIQKQKLFKLDIRGFNADRHPGNLSSELKPIDHGCLATRSFTDHAILCWMDWEETDLLFLPEMKEKIQAIDWAKDEEEILKYIPDMDPERLVTLKYSTLLLKKGVEAGLTPFEIGSFMTGHGYGGVSVMRTIYEEAIGSSDFDAAMNRLIDESIQFLQSRSDLKKTSPIRKIYLKSLPTLTSKEKKELSMAERDERKEAIRTAIIDHLSNLICL